VPCHFVPAPHWHRSFKFAVVRVPILEICGQPSCRNRPGQKCVPAAFSRIWVLGFGVSGLELPAAAFSIRGRSLAAGMGVAEPWPAPVLSRWGRATSQPARKRKVAFGQKLGASGGPAPVAPGNAGVRATTVRRAPLAPRPAGDDDPWTCVRVDAARVCVADPWASAEPAGVLAPADQHRNLALVTGLARRVSSVPKRSALAARISNGAAIRKRFESCRGACRCKKKLHPRGCHRALGFGAVADFVQDSRRANTPAPFPTRPHTARQDGWGMSSAFISAEM
jgi:hypothetical protein